MSKTLLNYAEFYITNICNFNCSGCNRFNNFNFSGQQRWDDYASIYREWSKKIDLKKWTVLGGEPFTNPTYLDWFEGIAALWPNAKGHLLTNGHYLDHNNDRLYNILKKNPKLELSIGLHNDNRQESVLSVVKRWLKGEVKISRTPDDISQLPGMVDTWKKRYNIIKDDSWPECDHPNMWESLPAHIKKECAVIHNFSPEIIAKDRLEFKLVDSNGVSVVVAHENFFHQGAIKHTKDIMTLHNSDPEKAHNICHSKTCHHFMNGKLYKCGQVALFPEFDNQFGLTLDQSQQELMNAYIPLSVDDSNEQISNFILNIENSIPQCTFCPEEYDMQQIFASTQKIKLKKRKNLI